MYATYLKKYLEGRNSQSPNSQINELLSYYIDHISLAVRVTLKLRRGLNAITLMALLSFREVLQWKNHTAAVCCTCPMRCCPRVLSSNGQPWKYGWRMPQFMGGLRGWKGAKMSALLAQKDRELRVPGNFSTGTMMVPQNRVIKYVRVLSTANSNLVLRFCLNSIYTYK